MFFNLKKKSSPLEDVSAHIFALLCSDALLNPHSVENSGQLLKGALDTLNATLHLWWSS